VRETTFRDLHQQVSKLYHAKAYTQAFELVEEKRAAFPENADEIAYWRLCFHALVGKREEAVRIFRETLDQGGWFGPSMLEQDPDLVDLRPLPEFQEMVEVCRQRLAEIKGTVQPELLVEKPVEQAAALPLLIALHGNEGNARDTIGEWSGIIAHGWLLGVPTSSQIVGPGCFIWDEREIGISQVRKHLAQLSSEYRIDPERVVLGGFSMGGGLAIWMALHQSIKTCGFIALGPYLSEEELEALPDLLAQHKPHGLRGSIVVGAEDVVHLNVSRKVVEIMHAHDLPCELELLPGFSHIYPADFQERVTKWLMPGLGAS
jgi:Phospholipase/Carboxylesterase